MKISIIVIGDELLLGQVTDTNSGMIARHIAPYGWSVESVETVPDSHDQIIAAIRRAMHRSRVVITTGGLGPTRDDITKAAMLEVFGGKLVEDAEVAANVRRIMEGRGHKLNALTATQALVPDSATIIQNLCGTAPIMWFDTPDSTLVAMPGVPAETSRMFEQEVFPRLFQRFSADTHVRHTTLTVSGITESDLAERLATFEDDLPPYLHLAYLPQASVIRLRLDGSHTDGKLLDRQFDESLSKLETLCADLLLYRGGHTPAEELLTRLKAEGLTLATAESCTGGAIASALTSIPGCSEVFRGSVVAYCNSVKRAVLGVDASTLDKYGAVSEPVVIQMADGARKALAADIAIATSGIAGPGGATPGKPVGTVCIAVATQNETVATTYRFGGSRELVIRRATLTALALALRSTVPTNSNPIAIS